MKTLTRLDSRVVLSVTGPDASSFLDGLITNSLPPSEADTASYAALLTPQGKIISDMFVVPTQDGFYLDVPIQADEALLKRLKLFKLKAKVDIQLHEDLAVYIYSEEGYADPRHNDMPRRNIVSMDESVSTNCRHYHEHRIQLGIAEHGKDFGENEVFPADINMDLNAGVNYKKGCFVGQEVVSRMHRKGTARRRTLAFKFPDGPPPSQTPLYANETVIGELTSSQGDYALARIRIDRLEKASEQNHTKLHAEDKVAELIPLPGVYDPAASEPSS